MSQGNLFTTHTDRVPSAVFSPCQRYRYFLSWPTGVDASTAALGIFANPSKATAQVTDPTVRRWIGYCRMWGYGWAWVQNVRAWRETDPKLVPPDPEAIGPDTDDWIARMLPLAQLVVCGWGKLGGARGVEVERLIRARGVTPYALSVNADGSPGHPLYLPLAAKPMPMLVRP